MSTKRILGLLAVGAVGLGTVLAAPSAQAGGRRERTLLEFETMTGNQGPYVGTAGAIRGVNAGGLPWVLSAAHGELKANGKLEVEVVGLVLDPVDGRVPAALRGTVPAGVLAGGYKAVVSCQSVVNGLPAVVNVSTAAVAVTAGGDAEIEEKVALPSPCYAPVVFVTNAGGAWFAATGA